jgi:ssDNA-binding Zn-finger/Zn-ribbon topoisomerase 1
MVFREGKYGKFYGCSKYGSETSCNGTLQIKDIPVRKMNYN